MKGKINKNKSSLDIPTVSSTSINDQQKRKENLFSISSCKQTYYEVK